jgi:RNA polymerase sigma factor (sigma-70 family)
MNTETYHKLILNHCYIAVRMAKRRSRITRQATFDEILSAAFLGLVDAAAHYKEEKGEFKFFAPSYIRGAISKYFKELGWNYRSGVLWYSANVFSLSQGNDIIDERSNGFDELIEVLPIMNRKIVKWRYEDNLTSKEIAELVGVGESRISQILKSSLDLIKSHF